jgi:hypothetical protein
MGRISVMQSAVNANLEREGYLALGPVNVRSGAWPATETPLVRDKKMLFARGLDGADARD